MVGPTASPIPRLIHLIWLGSEPEPQLLGNIHRLQELNPGWEIRLWRDGDLDWLQNRSYFESAQTWAGRANIARYEIILQHGGFYVGADFEFLRPIDAAGLPAEGLVVVPERRGYFNNAFFAAAPHHPFLARLVGHVGPSIDFHSRCGHPTQVFSGPVFFTDELLTWSEETGGRWSEIPRDLVYPYSWDKLAHHSGPWSPDVIAVHAWNQARNGPARIDSRRARVRIWDSWSSRLAAQRRIRVEAEALRRRIAPRWGPNRAFLGRDKSYHRFLSRTLSGSDVYVDVGANTGQFVATAARVLSSYGRVFAYEPNPRTADTLALNIGMNHDAGARAEVIQRRVAVSDSAGSAGLHVTLDDELGRVSRIRLIKIAVGGHEPAVLAGAEALVQSGRVDLIAVESIRVHLGRRVIRLGSVLDRWQDMGAMVSEIGSAGELKPIDGRASAIVAASDREHLVLDLRPIRERILGNEHAAQRHHARPVG